MRSEGPLRPRVHLLKWLVVLIVCAGTFGIVSHYPNYLPPNFDLDFLIGRENQFQGLYRIAFFAHILAAPCTLLMGLVLLNRGIRIRWPAIHRFFGRTQVLFVLVLVVPSGLWMSGFAFTGPVAGSGFATLAILTGYCAAMGWRHAVQLQFENHRRWMTRCYVLLCSALVLRVMSGAMSLVQPEAWWPYPIAAWASWLLPSAGWEWYERLRVEDLKKREHR